MKSKFPNSSARARRTIGALAAASAVFAGSMVAAAPANAIIGGNPASRSSYPYFARIDGGGSMCGGSVIAPTWVLTAAHCVDNLTAGQVKVGLNGRTHPAFSIGVHPLWNGNASDGHDLAVVMVPASATTKIVPVQVGTVTDPGAFAAGNQATMLGLGLTDPSSPSSVGVFHELKTVLRSDDDMDDIYNKWYWFDHWNSSLMIGAGWTNHTACSGDSGGPLTVRRGGKTVQVGVASFVRSWPGKCDEPAGFAQLSHGDLAWLGTIVRSIADRWGPCTTRHGSAGKYVAFYGASPLYPHRDGRMSWKIECLLPGKPGPTDSTPPGPKPPADHVCQNKPWTPGCED